MEGQPRVCAFTLPHTEQIAGHGGARKHPGALLEAVTHMALSSSNVVFLLPAVILKIKRETSSRFVSSFLSRYKLISLVNCGLIKINIYKNIECKNSSF